MKNLCFNKTAKRITLTLVAMLLMTAASAMPAKPGQKRQLTLADGTTVSAQLVGDEHGHYWLADNGQAYQDVDGSNVFQLIDKQTVDEKARVRRQVINKQRARRLPGRRVVGKFGDYTGDKKGLVILVNFSDVSFKAANNQARFQDIANKENYVTGSFKGSVHDYFYAQSEGKFNLTFDVVGPVTVSKAQSYYGGNNSYGEDKHPAEMVIEALKLVNNDVNFKDYDWDGDGYVDQVYVIYAGKGEADGGGVSTIWPHEYELSTAGYYGDGAGRQRMDGVYIDTYACGPELKASGTIDGIGTMCHEFSHCLGYPDFYDVDYSGGQGMGEWDLLDSGAYNGDGFRPAGYTSYERWMAGWLEPIELEGTTEVEGMKALQNGGDAYIIYNKGHRNEYFLLENRQKTAWDTSLPGKGLLILHVDYDADVWANNQPNDDPNRQRMTWIPADNKYQSYTYSGTKYYDSNGMATDTYPYGSNNAFGPNTTPAAKFYNKNADGTYYLESTVENIKQNSDGTVSFSFRAPVIKKDVYMTFSTDKVVVTLGDDFAEPTLTTRPEGISVTYSSSNTGVATVDAETGRVSIEGVGSTEITASFAGDDDYNEASATYTIRVKRPAGPAEEGSFELVTDATVLDAGQQVMIAVSYNDEIWVMSTKQNTNNRSATNKVIVNDNGTLEPDEDEDAQLFILEKDGDCFLFSTDEGYLYAGSSNSNWLRTEETADDNARALISIDDEGMATIVFQGSNSRNNLRFNPNNGNPIFSAYAETSTIKTLPMIFRQITDETITGITTVKQKQDANVVYNLQGQRVSGRQMKGIYIVNGRKVMK